MKNWIVAGAHDWRFVVRGIVMRTFGDWVANVNLPVPVIVISDAVVVTVGASTRIEP